MRIALYNLHFSTLGGGERRTAALAEHLSQRHDTSLYIAEPMDMQVIKRMFGVDLERVRVVVLGPADHFREIEAGRHDLFINNSHGSRLACPARVGVYMCMFPSQEPADLGSYAVITANSQFTAGWIQRWWGRTAEVVYSACASMGPPASKQRMILNVARFSADRPDNHHKRQDTLLHAFLGLHSLHDAGWELHFVGNIRNTPDDNAYLAALRAAAGQHRVYFHLGLGLEHLRSLYRQASLYWHATGYGLSEEDHPEKQEHFGISVVEAMSAGAIPLVLNAGGPREIVQSGVNGYLWNNLRELEDCTQRLAIDGRRCEEMAAQAVVTSARFTVDRYLARMDEVIERVTREREAPACRS